LCCMNSYLICPPRTCLVSASTFCCCSSQTACFPPAEVPSMCAPIGLGLVVYPKFACCKTLGDILTMADQKEKLATLTDDEKGRIVCNACCCGPIFSGAGYCHGPQGCCSGDNECLCLGSDCAFPCKDSVPNTFGLLCMCQPKCGICPKLGDILDENKFIPLSQQLSTE